MTPDILKKKREMLGLSQKQLAERMGIKHTLIAKYESGKGQIPNDFMDKFNEMIGKHFCA